MAEVEDLIEEMVGRNLGPGFADEGDGSGEVVEAELGEDDGEAIELHAFPVCHCGKVIHGVGR